MDREKLIQELNSADLFLRNRAGAIPAPLTKYDIDIMRDISSVCDKAARALEKAVVPPCKIGDEAWIIRNYRGAPTPQKGIVSSISFTDDMGLAIAVKHIGRGRWGVNIFPTYEEAEKAIKERESE